jgi:ATP-binding cassette subfamily F protein 3
VPQLEPTKGEIYRNTRLRVASFTQHHIDQLDLSKSALANIVASFPEEEDDPEASFEGEHLKFRRHLGAFGVSGPMALRPVRQMSGGQKSRVALAMITWREPHIIVMDEPTNHLDMETIDALIKALNAYQGGVILVSHDVHFVGSIVNELYVVADGGVQRFDGTVAQYKDTVVKSITGKQRRKK